jgi:hypothetical protein
VAVDGGGGRQSDGDERGFAGVGGSSESCVMEKDDDDGDCDQDQGLEAALQREKEIDNRLAELRSRCVAAASYRCCITSSGPSRGNISSRKHQQFVIH